MKLSRLILAVALTGFLSSHIMEYSLVNYQIRREEQLSGKRSAQALAKELSNSIDTLKEYLLLYGAKEAADDYLSGR